MTNQIDTLPMPADQNTPARPWGLWATFGWTLLAFAAAALAAIAAGAALAR